MGYNEPEVQKIREIIQRMTSGTLSDLKQQVSLIETYDPSLWESLSQNILRARGFLNIAKRIGVNARELNKLEREIHRSLNEAVEVLTRSRNPYHKARALASFIRPMYELGYEGLEDVVWHIIKECDKIWSREKRIKAWASVLLGVAKLRDAKKSIPRELEGIAGALVSRILEEIESVADPVKKADLLATFTDVARGIDAVVRRGDERVIWVDTTQAEAITEDILSETKGMDIYSAGLIKAKVAYIYKTMSDELTTKGDELFDEALEAAFALYRRKGESRRKAGKLLSEVAFYKAMAGDEGEAEILFEESADWVLREAGLQAIIDALDIVEKAGRVKLNNTASAILEEKIIPRINEIRDRVIRAGLKAYAADVAAWISFSLSDRLLGDAVSEIYYADVSDIRGGFQLYIFSLGLGRAALANPAMSESLFSFLLDVLQSIYLSPKSSIGRLGAYWLGMALGALQDIPAYYEVAKGAILGAIRRLRTVIMYRRMYMNSLIDFAMGLLKKQDGTVELVLRLIAEDMRIAVRSPKLATRLCTLAKRVSRSFYERVLTEIFDYIERILESGERARLAEYVVAFLKKADTETSSAVMNYILDMATEDSTILEDLLSAKGMEVPLEELNRIDPLVAEKIRMLEGKRRAVDKSPKLAEDKKGVEKR